MRKEDMYILIDILSNILINHMILKSLISNYDYETDIIKELKKVSCNINENVLLRLIKELDYNIENQE